MSQTDIVREGDASAPDAWALRSVALGGGPLAQALQADTSLHDWLLPAPRDLAGWKTRLQAVRDAHTVRDWLSPIAAAFSATGPAADRLARAAASGVVVTTGQQPGLFGGPAYTFSKAISALAMADALEEATGIPVAPVFWAATDDADWIEAAVTHVATVRGLETLQLEGPATDGVAMSDVPLGVMVHALRALREACGSSAHQSVLDIVEHAYVPHATIGAAYVELLRALLEPLGIAVLDASHPALRAAADPYIRRALQFAGPIADALSLRTGDIVAAGFDPQVALVDDLTLVFRTESGASGRERDRMRTRVPLADAPRVLREAELGTLGANVLLRPVIERALLPTVSYHAGPGEFSYFAQVAPIARAMGTEVPCAVPRWSGELIDLRAERLQRELGLSDSTLRDPHAAQSQVARDAVDANVQDAFERLRVALETQLNALRAAMERADDLVPSSVIDGVGKQIEARFDRLERRVVAGVKRRETHLMRDVAAVRAAIRPDGQSPERRLNLVPMLARFGPAIFVAMRNEARAYVERLVHGY